MMNPATKLLLVMFTILNTSAAFDPGKPQRKTWWARHVTDDFYTAGHISARQIKYAQEDGFKSIISVSKSLEPITNGLEEFPTSTDCQKIAKTAGIRYEVIVPPSGNWRQDLEFVRLFTVLADSLPKPILVHGHVSYSALFILLNYFANKSRNDSNFSPKVNAKSFFEIATVHGMNYNEPDLKETVSMVTGEQLTQSVAVPDIPMGQEWWQNWQIKPVFKNIFISGQSFSTRLSLLSNTGFKSLINNRKGVTLGPDDPTPSQEEVTLLNIRDRTGTYAEGGRQKITRLEATRIDPNRPNIYISNTSKVNYEARNPLEFGDDVGYNERMERLAVETTEMKYYHHPVGSVYIYNVASWNAMRPDIREAIERGPVLFKCRTAYRSGIWALLAAADYYGLDINWVLKRSKELGFNHGSNSPQVKLWKEVLKNKTNSGHKMSFIFIAPLLSFWLEVFV